ncbi:MAG: EFR1 family ferrodoxin [Clostridiales bacterium]|nr:EFR1 family ferrodoxin [Clostridiales bacterium]MBO4580255.1 EFR1 family ferrodoxin [Clostridiales bacterium]
MIFYFSGTGNSRFVAKGIARTIGQEAVDITTYTRTMERPDFTDTGVYVFVCPSYMSAPARAMTDFVEWAGFPQGVKAYFIVTCAASMGITPRVSSEICDKKGMKFMGAEQIEMPQNYIAHFTTKQVEENIDIIEKAENEIERISGLIRNGEVLECKKIGAVEYSVTKWVRDVYYKDFMKTKKFKATDKCIACGKCTKVCPLSNITIENKRPVWGDKCTHCMACINQCPVDAIEYGKGSVGKPRYKGPEAGKTSEK